MLEINYQDIGKRIKVERKKAGLSQQKLAELADLAPSNISHIERGTTKLSLPTLVSITNALEVPLATLLTEVVNRSEEQYKQQLAEFLSDCTCDEYRLVLAMAKALLDTLHENDNRNPKQ